ncbi:GNAT family N-acetyltransferase [Pelomonas sp. V22]|uniref:GNAT family N-acetyltransferase n=1 Tax=Pelomonas sp. V22 TaxID=2822139 RepID=UPI0024A833FE|nr:GNAT family N-acetyltransferase [Pelomonas sp. V22]MDI4633542.1 GNAT family N-acetyltransferase [Pelomonas sp. V22]
MISLDTRLTTAAAFKALYDTTGWGPPERDTDYYARALAGSWFSVSAYAGDELVGFARVISDGHLHAFITEMIVAPAFQAQCLGSQLLDAALAACHAASITDVQLFCARGKQGFYEKHGFLPRPQDGPGMQLVTGV